MRAARVWHFPERESYLWLPAGALAELRRIAKKALPNEAGGTLVGHYTDDMKVACVERVLGVRTGGRQGKSWFYRPPDSIDRQLAEIYEQTGGAVYYLGEWHSHPGADPDPSAVDLNTLVSLARSKSVATDTPILLVLGGDVRAAAQISCYLGLSSGQVIGAAYLGTMKQFPTGNTGTNPCPW